MNENDRYNPFDEQARQQAELRRQQESDIQRSYEKHAEIQARHDDAQRMQDAEKATSEAAHRRQDEARNQAQQQAQNAAEGDSEQAVRQNASWRQQQQSNEDALIRRRLDDDLSSARLTAQQRTYSSSPSPRSPSVAGMPNLFRLRGLTDSAILFALGSFIYYLQIHSISVPPSIEEVVKPFFYNGDILRQPYRLALWLYTPLFFAISLIWRYLLVGPVVGLHGWYSGSPANWKLIVFVVFCGGYTYIWSKILFPVGRRFLVGFSNFAEYPGAGCISRTLAIPAIVCLGWAIVSLFFRLIGFIWHWALQPSPI